MLKGLLEGCVLSIISKKETYGYEIINKLSEYGFNDIKDGTLYPIINRLKKKDYVQIENSKDIKRNYISITDNGKAFLMDFKNTYLNIYNNVNNVLFKEYNYES